MSENKKSFLFVDVNDDTLQSKSGLKFGLNTGVVDTFQFVKDAGKDGAPANAVYIHVKSGDSKPVRLRLYVDPSPYYFGKGDLQISKGEEGYDELYYADMTQKVAVIKQVLHALGVDNTKINAVINENDIVGSIERMVNLAPAGYDKKEVDFFLEWQWQIGNNQERTFLEFPKNMKGGKAMVAAIKPVGKWKEVVNEDGLSYKDDAGNVHVFKRSMDYLQSPKGYPQGKDVVLPSWKQEDKSQTPQGDTAQSTTW